MNNIVIKRNYVLACLMALSLSLFISCTEEFTSPEPITGTTLSELAAADTTLQIFTAALAKTGVGISLGNINSGQHTVFAPTDSAFRVFFQPLIGGGPGDAAIITYVNNLSGTSNPTLANFILRLQYHVLSSEAKSADVTNSAVFTTINGARLSLSKTGSTVLINANAGTSGAKTRKLDIDGANGVIHTVNKFITAISISTTNGAASVITSTGFGLGLRVDYTTSPPTVTKGVTGGNNYDLFALSVRKTGLAPVLRPNVPLASLPDFTLFVPDDAAMITYLGTLSGGTVTDEATGITYINGLASDDPKLATLTSVVKYHVVSGRVLSTDIAADQEVSTLLTGKKFSVSSITPSVVLEDQLAGTATVTTANVLSNAGVIHRINAVMKPQ
jgi:uncharacterized surface protein with fasciclin (FAS1) repeats